MKRGIFGRLRDLASRRRVLGGGMEALVASFVAPTLLRHFLTAQPAATPAPQPAPTPPPAPKPPTLMKSKIAKKPIDPRFASFLGEKLVYDVNFLWTVKAAQVTVTLTQGLGEEIIAELEAKALGVVGWATSTKRQAFKTRLVVREIDGQKRLMATNFSRLSEKGGVTTKTLHRFDYEKRQWTFQKFVNGKRTSKHSKKIPPDVKYYEDFVGFVYNVRAGAYGDFPPGKTMTLKTIPFKGVDQYTLRVATAEETKTEQDWIDKTPGAKYLGLVTIHQKIFGLKTGEARILANDKFLPIAAKVKDAVTFGDVTTTLVKFDKVPAKG